MIILKRFNTNLVLLLSCSFVLGLVCMFLIKQAEVNSLKNNFTYYTNAYMKVNEINQELENRCNNSFAVITACMPTYSCGDELYVRKFREVNLGNDKLRQERKTLLKSLGIQSITQN